MITCHHLNKVICAEMAIWLGACWHDVSKNEKGIDSLLVTVIKPEGLKKQNIMKRIIDLVLFWEKEVLFAADALKALLIKAIAIFLVVQNYSPTVTARFKRACNSSS